MNAIASSVTVGTGAGPSATPDDSGSGTGPSSGKSSRLRKKRTGRPREPSDREKGGRAAKKNGDAEADADDGEEDGEGYWVGEKWYGWKDESGPRYSEGERW